MKVNHLFCAASLIMMFQTTLSHAVSSNRGEQVFKTCVFCHGPEGAGGADARAPSIAGMDEWYLKSQLTKFMKGIRGKHHKDNAGQRMHKISMTMRTSDIDIVSKYVAALPRPEPTISFNGDSLKGQAKFNQVCVTCHGAEGKGNQALQAPSLLGQNDWYLLLQLKNFKDKIRGGNASEDPLAAGMSGMAATLEDEQQMKDVVYYIQKGLNKQSK